MLLLEIMISGKREKYPIKGTHVNQDRIVEYGLPRILRNKWARVGHGEENLELAARWHFRLSWEN